MTEMTPGSLSLAPQARQQMAAVAELRWRIFANSLRTFRGRLELASRIFISLAFLAGGIGGAVGLGGAAWFVISQGNPEWLGALLWPVFLFWQLFPLMATAFTQNVESSNLLRFPLSYRLVLSDPPGLRIAGPGHGGGQPVAARNRYRHRSRPAESASLGHDCAPDLCPGEPRSGSHAVCLAGALAGAAAHARNHGHSFLSLYSEFSVDRSVDRSLRTSVHTRDQNPGAETLQRAAAASAGPGRRCDCGNVSGQQHLACHGQRGSLSCCWCAMELHFSGF